MEMPKRMRDTDGARRSAGARMETAGSPGADRQQGTSEKPPAAGGNGGADPKKALAAGGAIVAACAIAALAIIGGSSMLGPTQIDSGNQAQTAGQQETAQDAGGSEAGTQAETTAGDGLTTMPNGDKAVSYTTTANKDGSITYTYTDEDGNEKSCTDLNGDVSETAAAKPASSTGSRSSAAAKDTASAKAKKLKAAKKTTTAASCDHEWKPVYKTVKTKAEYKSTYHPAVTEEVAETTQETVCNTCKATITGKVKAHIAQTGHTGYTKGVAVTATRTVVKEAAHTDKELVKEAGKKKVDTGKVKCAKCGKVKKAAE